MKLQTSHMYECHFSATYIRSPYGRDLFGNPLPLELSIETGEARELEHREERLGVELGTPVPCRGQPTVDATIHTQKRAEAGRAPGGAG